VPDAVAKGRLVEPDHKEVQVAGGGQVDIAGAGVGVEHAGEEAGGVNVAGTVQREVLAIGLVRDADAAQGRRGDEVAVGVVQLRDEAAGLAARAQVEHVRAGVEIRRGSKYARRVHAAGPVEGEAHGHVPGEAAGDVGGPDEV